jgi:hypothetical protein
MKITSRKAWGARAPKKIEKTSWKNRTEVIFHHGTGPSDRTGSDASIVRDYQAHHMDNRGWNDIGYNFLIGVGGDDDGTIYEGRGWLTIGAHCTGHNTSGVGVCFIGDFRLGHSVLTPKAEEAAAWVYQEACRRAGKTLAYTGHGRVKGAVTACPGGQVLAWIDARGPEKRNVSPAIPKTVRLGSTGSAVKLAQNRLIHHQGRACLPRYGADGDFGQETLSAVKRFQSRNSLVRDGVVGPKTWAKLLKD